MIFDLTPIRPIHNDAVPDTHFFSQNTVYNMCVSCPPFFKAPRFALRGGWDKYVSPAPQASPKDLVVIYSCGSTWGDLFRAPPVPS